MTWSIRIRRFCNNQFRNYFSGHECPRACVFVGEGRLRRCTLWHGYFGRRAVRVFLYFQISFLISNFFNLSLRKFVRNRQVRNVFNANIFDRFAIMMIVLQMWNLNYCQIRQQDAAAILQLLRDNLTYAIRFNFKKQKWKIIKLF